METNKPFKILSIDGGGIRGIFPAMFLVKVEAELKSRGIEKWQIYQNFDLICGTSTGGIIALALSYGISAQEVYNLYIDNASKIFGNPKNFLKKIRFAAHERDELEKLAKDLFKSKETNDDLRLKDCKTPVCIPIYDLLNGKPSIIKSNYHPSFTRDYHIPAYQVALATSAAPTFFVPYTANYKDLNNVDCTFSNKVDGGVIANNPTLVGIIEAQKAFKQDLKNLRVLSLGTGHQKFTDGSNRKNWGWRYWILSTKSRLIDLFLQGQSQQVQNLVSLLQNGIDGVDRNNPSFLYDRIDTEIDNTLSSKLDETDRTKLERLAEKASHEYNNQANHIIERYFN